MNQPWRWLGALLALAAASSAAAEPLPISTIVVMPGEKAQVDAFKERLRRVPYLAGTHDTFGNNVILIVSVAQVPTGGGSAASTMTGLLAASTLGILPTVENKDISVHYELRVNQMRVAAFDYTRNFTSVSNIYGQYGKLPDDARQWLMQTVDSLERDIQASQPLAALQAEYDSYFRR